MPGLSVTPGLLRVSTFAARYWAAIEGQLSVAWAERSKAILDEITADLGAVRLDQLDEPTVLAWWGRLRRRHANPSTANKYLVRLRHACRCAVRWGLMAHDPTVAVRKLREGRGRTRYLTAEERALLLSHANPTLRLYILFARYTAGRRRSLLAVEERDVDAARKTVTFRDTKNGEDHTVPVPDALWPTVAELLTGSPRRKLLPVITPHALSQAFRRLAARLGLRDVRFHDLRHDVASSIVMGGGSLRLVMEVLGHKDPRMSLRYAHLQSEGVREVLNQVL